MTLFGVIHTFRTPIVSLKDRTFGKTLILPNCINFSVQRHHPPERLIQRNPLISRGFVVLQIFFVPFKATFFSTYNDSNVRWVRKDCSMPYSAEKVRQGNDLYYVVSKMSFIYINTAFAKSGDTLSRDLWQNYENINQVSYVLVSTLIYLSKIGSL